jgi:hypothetical protein
MPRSAQYARHIDATGCRTLAMVRDQLMDSRARRWARRSRREALTAGFVGGEGN